MLGEHPIRELDHPVETTPGTANNGDGGNGPVAAKRGAHRRQSCGPNRVLLSVLVLAAASATVSLVLLLVRSDPAEVVDDAPLMPAPPVQTEPNVPAIPRPVQQAPPVVPAPAMPPAPPAPTPPTESAPRAPAPPLTRAVVEAPADTARPAPPPAAEPSPPAGESAPPSPTTRAPISVEPEPRPAFPHQELPELGGRDRGGLLGGGGLL